MSILEAKFNPTAWNLFELLYWLKPYLFIWSTRNLNILFYWFSSDIYMFYRSFSILTGSLLSFGFPSFIFIIVSSIRIHRLLQVRNDQHRLDLFHDFGQFFCWCPIFASLYHIFTDSSVSLDVGMVNFSLEWNQGSFEWEIVKLELKFKLSSFKWSLLWPLDENGPNTIVLISVNDVTSS